VGEREKIRGVEPLIFLIIHALNASFDTQLSIE